MQADAFILPKTARPLPKPRVPSWARNPFRSSKNSKKDAIQITCWNPIYLEECLGKLFDGKIRPYCYWRWSSGRKRGFESCSIWKARRTDRARALSGRRWNQYGYCPLQNPARIRLIFLRAAAARLVWDRLFAQG